MNLYKRFVLPHLINCTCGVGQVKRLRGKVIPQASGKVLEVGFGSGYNLPHYTADQVKRILAVEPDAAMRHLAERRMRQSAIPCEVLLLEAEAIPLPDASMDSVVVTFALCTIPGVEQALAEMRRVLKPGGALLFAEHGLAPDANVQKWQHRLEPVWKPLAGGCHLTRDPVAMIADAGFAMQDLQQAYMRRAPHFAGYMSHGVAIKR